MKTIEQRQELISQYVSLYTELYGDVLPCDLSSVSDEDLEQAVEELKQLFNNYKN